MAENVFFNEIGHMISCSRSNICQTPSSLELELGNMMMQETHQYWHEVGINDRLDWWLVLNGEELSKTDTGQELLVEIFGVNELTQSAKVGNLIENI
jgi:hypothetical protein